MLNQLNWNHLYYFWMVAREGGIANAADKLNLTSQTLSGQIGTLEQRLNQALFRRSGRHLKLTEFGQTVYHYSDSMFRTGAELTELVNGVQKGASNLLRIGVAEVVPKLITWRLLQPLMNKGLIGQLVCHEGTQEDMLNMLAMHQLDAVIADSPAPPSSPVRLFSHLLGDCGIGFFAAHNLAAKWETDFPYCLHQAPWLAPKNGTALRLALDRWFTERSIVPIIAAEFTDSALAKAFAQGGAGFVVGPIAIAEKIASQYQLNCFAKDLQVREQFYLVSADRQITHKAVIALREQARNEVFAD